MAAVTAVLQKPVEAIQDITAVRRAEHVARHPVEHRTLGVDAPENNVRVFKMFQEVAEFRTSFHDIQHQLVLLKQANLELMDSLAPLLLAPLPRVWEEVEGGLAEPARTTPTHEHYNIAGGVCDLDAIRRDVEDMEKLVAVDVLQPMRQWNDALRSAQAHLPELESLRNDALKRAKWIENAKARTRKATRVAAGVAEERGISHTSVGAKLLSCIHPSAATFPSDPEVAGEGAELLATQEYDARMSHKERKLSAARESFRDAERLLYEQLSGLCRDSSWTKTYVLAALLATKEMFQAEIVHLGPTKQPLPSFASKVALGQVADNYELAAHMPESTELSYLGERPDETALRRGTAAVATIHARRGTAQPMETHARTDVSGASRVPPVRKALMDSASVERQQQQQQQQQLADVPPSSRKPMILDSAAPQEELTPAAVAGDEGGFMGGSGAVASGGAGSTGQHVGQYA